MTTFVFQNGREVLQDVADITRQSFAEDCISRKDGQSEFVVELNGKDGSGAGIYSMNCSNGRGYWKSNPSFMGISGAELEGRTDSALKKAFSIYC